MPEFDDDTLDEDELDNLIGLTELYESLDEEVIKEIEEIDEDNSPD